ncbi:GyrI-like domain-containing protein [Clostridiaceae bacterium M8S5]|nr:GyrI-like domain-containing protein [Clostridiaceae bacterium M8S5]
MNKTLLYQEYKARINKVQDYIEGNINEEFTLPKLATIANFSSYHFHRIFKEMTNETLFEYIQRVKLEKAAFTLLANKDKSIMDIALEYGFANQSSFAKAFKRYFNVNASIFRKQQKSNMRKVFSEIVCYNNAVRDKQRYLEVNNYKLDYDIEVKDIPEMNLAYIRHTGPYKTDDKLFEELFSKLYSWAKEKQLINSTNKWLTLYHDTPDITMEDKLRISVCLTVDTKIHADGEIGFMRIKGGKYGVGHFKLNKYEYQFAWNEMYARWLPNSGYQPRDSLAFEHYNGGTLENDNKQNVDICIPIKLL